LVIDMDSIMVLRPGQSEFSKVQDQDELEREIAQGNVIQGDGNSVQVVTRHTMRLDETKTALTLIGWRKSTLNLLDEVRRLQQRGGVVYLHTSALFMGVLVSALIGLTLNDTIVPKQVCLVLLVLQVGIIFGAIAFLQLSIVHKLLHSMHFWIRFSSALIACIALGTCLSDVRICVALFAFTLQVMTALGDALTGPTQALRIVFLVQLVLVLFVLEIVVYFGLLEYAFHTWTISPDFDYAALQLARDLYLGSLIVALFDLGFALRAAHRRFAHIYEPVKFEIIKFEDDLLGPNNIDMDPSMLLRKTKGVVNASQVEIQSGFLIQQKSYTSLDGGGSYGAAAEENDANAATLDTPAPKQAGGVKIYVDIVRLRQKDALAVHILGLENGRTLFNFLHNWKGQVAWNLALLPLILVLYAGPYLPSVYIYLVCIPFFIYHATRELATSSRTMLFLLIRRRQFQVQVVFLCIWLGLFCVVFPNSMIALALGFFITSLCELVKDASVRVSRRFSQLKNQILVGWAFGVLAVQMIWTAYPATWTEHLYVDFRPGLATQGGWSNATNGTEEISYSDLPQVEDLYQQLVDLSLALGVGHMLTAIYVFFAAKPGEFQVFHAPVCALFIVEEPSPARRAQVNRQLDKAGVKDKKMVVANLES